MKKPLFIALEGGEGSGKSTLITALKESLGNSVVVTREPGGSPYGEVIREAALKHAYAKDAPAETMLCLMFAARFDHVKNLVVPALDAGKHVITDRFDASSYTYQIYGQEASELEDLFWKLRSHLSRTPDLYIYIDVDAEEGVNRAMRRNNIAPADGNHFDDRKMDFHRRLRTGYDSFFKQVPHVIVDANRPLEEVKKDFLEAVKMAIDTKSR